MKSMILALTPFFFLIWQQSADGGEIEHTEFKIVEFNADGKEALLRFEYSVEQFGGSIDGPQIDLMILNLENNKTEKKYEILKWEDKNNQDIRATNWKAAEAELRKRGYSFKQNVIQTSKLRFTENFECVELEVEPLKAKIIFKNSRTMALNSSNGLYLMPIGSSKEIKIKINYEAFKPDEAFQPQGIVIDPLQKYVVILYSTEIQLYEQAPKTVIFSMDSLRNLLKSQ